jgi:bacterial translation initiation factor 3 (bIF-3)
LTAAALSEVDSGRRDDLDGRNLGDVAGCCRGGALLFLPAGEAFVVVGAGDEAFVSTGRFLLDLPRTGVFYSGSKVDHIPPALAAPGYRVSHSARFRRVATHVEQGAELPAGVRVVRGGCVSLPPATYPCRGGIHRTSEEFRISDPRTNDRIRVPEVRLVGPAGEQVGVVRIEVALRLAQEAELDLVEVAPNSKPPVVKIMDFGKFKYETAQKAKEARRNQANTVLKEVRFRLKIEAHDYTTKLKRAEGFLQSGDKVKAMILFRGREQSRPEQGVRLLKKFAEDVAEFGTVESNPTIDGRNMVMVVAPHKNKSEVKTEQNAQRAANKEAARQARTGSDADAAPTEPTAAE